MLRGDGDDVDASTVRHLLTHRSGIADDAGYEENYEGRFQQLIGDDPTFHWNRELEVQFAVDNDDPLAEPDRPLGHQNIGTPDYEDPLAPAFEALS